MEYIKCPNCGQLIPVDRELERNGFCLCCKEYEYDLKEIDGEETYFWFDKETV
jgi:ribosomal protein S26